MVKDIYKRFAWRQDLTQNFSQMVYEEVLEDQLDLLYTNYTSDKSQILEIVMINWLQCLENYKQYPKVIPKVMGMLAHQSVSIEVAGVILTFVKNLIVNSLHG